MCKKEKDERQAGNSHFFLNTNIQYDLRAIKTLWIYIVVIVNINFTIYFYVFQAFFFVIVVVSIEIFSTEYTLVCSAFTLFGFKNAKL